MYCGRPHIPRSHDYEPLARYLTCLLRNLRCTVSGTALAQFDSTGQLFHPARLYHYVLPSLIQGLLYILRYIDHLGGGNGFVPSVDEAIEDLVEPETVFAFAIFVQVWDLVFVLYRTLSSQRRDWTQIRMHGCIYHPCVVASSTNVSRSITPIDANLFDGRARYVGYLKTKFHDAADIVWFARRFAY